MPPKDGLLLFAPLLRVLLERLLKLIDRSIALPGLACQRLLLAPEQITSPGQFVHQVAELFERLAGGLHGSISRAIVSAVVFPRLPLGLSAG